MEQTELEPDEQLWDEELQRFNEQQENSASRPRRRWGRFLMLTAVLTAAGILLAIVLGLVYVIASVLISIGFFQAVLGIK